MQPLQFFLNYRVQNRGGIPLRSLFSPRKFGENRTGGAPVPPGLPAAVFEARMRENAREGQKL